MTGVIDNEQFNFYKDLRSMWVRPGTTVSDETLQNYRENYGIDLPSGTTKAELLAEVHRVFGGELINAKTTKIVEEQINDPLGPNATDVTLPSGDELITAIESKWTR